MKKTFYNLKVLLPYLILLLGSILSIYIFFFKGLPTADDGDFHLSMAYEIYFGFKQGIFFSSPSHLTLGGLGYYTALFYGPLSHHSIAIFAYLFEWAGVDIIIAYKIVAFLSIYISSIFTYWLGKRMSGNVYVALLGGVLYTFMPYRIFCYVCRGAFGESLSMAFIPLIFYGLYRILNDETPSIFAYVALIGGFSLIVLSHPFTALITSIFALIYILFNAKKLIRVIKNKLTIIYSLVSIVLIVGLISFYVFPLFSAEGAGIYRVSEDKFGVWATFEHVSTSSQISWMFSGFLNLYYISNHSETWGFLSQVDTLITSVFFFVIASIICAVIDHFLKKLPHSVYYRFVVDFAALFIFGLFLPRFEFLLALAVFYVAFVFMMVFKDYVKVDDEVETKRSLKDIFKDPDFYFPIFGIIVTVVLISVGNVWIILPQIFYNGQFAWRLWSLFSFFITLLTLNIFVYLSKYKSALVVGFSLTSLLLVVNQALVEKRMSFQMGGRWYDERSINEEFCTTRTRIGAMFEYAPNCFFDDSYTPTYTSGYFYFVKNLFSTKHYFYEKETYPAPLAVEGEGESNVLEMNSPNMVFEVSVTSEDALFQIPQFYYDGYSAQLTDIDNGERSSVDISFADGLIAFRVPKGNYTVDLDFVGTTTYKVGVGFAYASLVGTLGFLGYGIAQHYVNKRKKKNLILD